MKKINGKSPILSLFSKLKYFIDKTIDLFTIINLFLLISTVTIQVFSRYVLNNPLTWTSELARFLFIWLVFLSSSIVFRDRQHLSVDYFVKMLPAKIKYFEDIFIQIAIGLFLLVILYYAPGFISITMTQTSATLSIPMGLIYLSFPFSAALMLLELIFRAGIFFADRKDSV